jgi:hypothetical protein
MINKYNKFIFLFAILIFVFNSFYLDAKNYKYLGPIEPSSGMPSASIGASSIVFGMNYKHQRLISVYTNIELGTEPMNITKFAMCYSSNANSNTQSNNTGANGLSDGAAILIKFVDANATPDIPSFPTGMTTFNNSDVSN